MALKPHSLEEKRPGSKGYEGEAQRPFELHIGGEPDFFGEHNSTFRGGRSSIDAQRPFEALLDGLGLDVLLIFPLELCFKTLLASGLCGARRRADHRKQMGLLTSRVIIVQKNFARSK